MRVGRRIAIRISVVIAVLAVAATSAAAAAQVSSIGGQGQKPSRCVHVAATIGRLAPASIAVNPKTYTLHVTNTNGRVSVLNGRTNTITAAIRWAVIPMG